jgi:hypothetical protein
MKVRILGNVKHDNVDLTKYEVYDLPDNAAQTLLNDKLATTEGIEADTQVRNFTPLKNKVDPNTGLRVPGEFEPDAAKTKAKEPEGTGEVKGVEPASKTTVQGASEAPPENPENQQTQAESDDTQKKGD